MSHSPRGGSEGEGNHSSIGRGAFIPEITRKDCGGRISAIGRSLPDGWQAGAFGGHPTRLNSTKQPPREFYLSRKLQDSSLPRRVCVFRPWHEPSGSYPMQKTVK